jgi:hypothetical protein
MISLAIGTNFRYVLVPSTLKKELLCELAWHNVVTTDASG